MDDYRALQVILKNYRAAGFAVPALSGKKANLVQSYNRIQSSLQGQTCSLPTPGTGPVWLLTFYRWTLMAIALPFGALFSMVLLPFFWCFGDPRDRPRYRQ